MGENEFNISPVEETAERLAIFFGQDRAPSDEAIKAVELAGLDMSVSSNMDDLIYCIETKKPNLIIAHRAESTEPETLLDQIELARRSEKMPVLFVSDVPLSVGPAPQNFDVVSTGASAPKVFLAIRALLRRETPWVLEEVRFYGDLALDEARFHLRYGHQIAPLGKIDLSILGPFFDAPGHCFDRNSLQRLAYGHRQWKEKSRLIDAGICKTRDLLENHLGFNPIKTVRGVGYQLLAKCDLIQRIR